MSAIHATGKSDLLNLLRRLTMLAEKGALTDMVCVSSGPDLYDHSFVIPEPQNLTAMIGELELMRMTLAGHMMGMRGQQVQAKAQSQIVVPSFRG